MSRAQAALTLFFSAAVWGLAFIFQKSALEHVGPLTFTAARSVVASLALAPLALREAKRRAPAGRGFRRWSVAGGVAFFLGAWLQQSGLESASVTNTGFLTALYVVLTPLIAWAVNGGAPRPIVWLGVALSALGTCLLGGGSFSALSEGDARVALSAVFWAGHVVISGRAASFRCPVTFTCLGFAVVAGLAAPCAYWAETPTSSALVEAAVDIAYVGLLSSALAFSLLIWALEHVPPAEGAVIASMETVFAALAAYLLLGERLPVSGWTGASLILAASLVVQLGPLVRAARVRVGA